MLRVARVEKAHLTRGGAYTLKMAITVEPGYHVNSDAPDDEYLIPLKLTWNKGPLEAESIAYPKPTREKYAFSDKPLAVFSGTFVVSTRFRVSAAAPEMGIATGKLRYQACNDKECLQPKTVSVQLPFEAAR